MKRILFYWHKPWFTANGTRDKKHKALVYCKVWRCFSLAEKPPWKMLRNALIALTMQDLFTIHIHTQKNPQKKDF